MLKGTGATLFDGKPGIVDVDVRALIVDNKAIDAFGIVHAGFGCAKASVDFSVSKHGIEGMVHAAIIASVPALEELRTFHKQLLAGRVDLEGSADFDFGKQTFALTVRMHVIGFKHLSVALPEGAIAIQAEGTPIEPKFVAAVVAWQIVLTLVALNLHRLHDVDMKVAGMPKLFVIDGKFTIDVGQKLMMSMHLLPIDMGVRVIGMKLHVERQVFVVNIMVKEALFVNGVFLV